MLLAGCGAKMLNQQTAGSFTRASLYNNGLVIGGVANMVDKWSHSDRLEYADTAQRAINRGQKSLRIETPDWLIEKSSKDKSSAQIRQ